MTNSKTTIVRTAVGSPASVGLIKELRKRGIRVVGTDCNPLSAGFYFCDKSYVVPRGDELNFVEELLKICEKEKPKAIISGPEEEILTLSKNKKLFEKRDILVLVPAYRIARTCADKVATDKFFKKEGIPTPKIYRKNEVEFPIIIKPRWGRGSTNVFKAKNKEELEVFSRKVKEPIFQEFIKGKEYTIDVFADLEGEPLSVVPRERIRVESGISFKGKTVYDQEMINFCEKIVRKLRIKGPSCIQCIKDNRGPKFIEINTRFGGGSILSMKADPTIIPNLIRIIKGKKPIKSKGFKEGITTLRYYSEVYSEDL